MAKNDHKNTEDKAALEQAALEQAALDQETADRVAKEEAEAEEAARLAALNEAELAENAAKAAAAVVALQEKNSESTKQIADAKQAERDAIREADIAKAELDAKIRAEEPAAYYYAVFGGPMIDPDTNKVFTGTPIKSHLTSWLQLQISQGKMAKEVD